MMEHIATILTSNNGVMILVIVFLGVVVLMFLGKNGFFYFKNKNLTIGRTEDEVRAIILKQKEFLLQYCSCLTINLITDLAKFGKDMNYVYMDYVVEKVVDDWLGWMLVNHVSEDEAYIRLKIVQSQLTMLRAVGRVDSELLKDETIVQYFDKICEKTTREIIKGLLEIYNVEKKGVK